MLTDEVRWSLFLRLGKNNVRPSNVLHLIRRESTRSSDAGPGTFTVVILGMSWLGRGNDSPGRIAIYLSVCGLS